MNRRRERPAPDPGVEAKIESYRRRGLDNQSESFELFLQELRERLAVAPHSQRTGTATRYPGWSLTVAVGRGDASTDGGAS